MYRKNKFLIIFLPIVFFALVWFFLRPKGDDQPPLTDVATIVAPKESPSMKANGVVSNSDAGKLVTGESDQQQAVEVGVPNDSSRTIVDKSVDPSQPEKAPTGDQLKSRAADTAAATPSQGSVSKKISFPGIKQDGNFLMLAALDYIPGNDEDTFVATFKRLEQGYDRDEILVWLIADYVQRGTTQIMAIPSHAGLKLNPAGAPQNTAAGSRVVFANARAQLASKKFSLRRPGFEGEEISGVRVGIFDRQTSKLHMARVSGASLMRKSPKKRARVVSP